MDDEASISTMSSESEPSIEDLPKIKRQLVAYRNVLIFGDLLTVVFRTFVFLGIFSLKKPLSELTVTLFLLIPILSFLHIVLIILNIFVIKYALISIKLGERATKVLGEVLFKIRVWIVCIELLIMFFVWSKNFDIVLLIWSYINTICGSLGFLFQHLITRRLMVFKEIMKPHMVPVSECPWVAAFEDQDQNNNNAPAAV